MTAGIYKRPLRWSCGEVGGIPRMVKPASRGATLLASSLAAMTLLPAKRHPHLAQSQASPSTTDRAPPVRALANHPESRGWWSTREGQHAEEPCPDSPTFGRLRLGRVDALRFLHRLRCPDPFFEMPETGIAAVAVSATLIGEC